VSQIVPILLIGLGGFLIGGVVAVRKNSVPAAVLLGIFAAGCIVGGLLWLVGDS
jgi:hypothetical protein